MSGNNNSNKGGSKSQCSNSNVQGNKSSGGWSSSTSNNSSQPMSDNQFLKSYGGKTNFMASHGIKPSAEGFKEAKDLMDQMREQGGLGKSPYRKD